MHLILLLNFNTALAVYPADEIELIALPSEPRLGAGAAAAGGRGGSAQLRAGRRGPVSAPVL